MKEVEDFWHDYSAIVVGYGGVFLLNLVTFTMVIRLLSPDQFGMFNLFMSVAQVGLLFGSNWSANAMIRYGKEEALADGTMRKAFWARMVLFGITAMVFLTLFFIFRHRILSYMGGSWHDFFLVSGYFIVLSLSSMLLCCYQIMGRMWVYSLVPVIEKSVYGLLLLLLVVNVFFRNAGCVISFLFLASFFTSLVLFVNLKKKWVLPVRTSRGAVAKLFYFSWPAFIGCFGGYVVNWIDVIVIKLYLNTAAVGIYSVAYNMYTYIMAVPLMGVNLISMILTAFIVRKREDLVMVYVRRLVPQVIFLWSFFVSMIIIISGPVFHVWAGPQYRLSVPLFIVLAMGLFFRGIICAYTPLFDAYIMPKRCHTINIIIAVLNFLGDFILIPRYGMMGAAVSTTLAFSISSVILLAMTIHRFKIVCTSYMIYMLPVMLCGVVSLSVQNSMIRFLFFMVVFFVAIIFARVSRLFLKEDNVFLESIKMPMLLKMVIFKFIHMFVVK